MKFGRLFAMSIEGRDGTHIVQSPMTVRFRVVSNTLFSCGESVFIIYNLAQDVRSDLYKDWYQIFTYRRITFAAGYQADSANPGAITLPTIFQGNVVQASSYRQGPDWITEIHALDGGFAIDNASVNLTKPTPYNFNDMLTDAIRAMPSVKLGVMSTFDIDNSRGLTFCGNPWDLITQRMLPLQGQAFINKEQVNILQQWEYIVDTGLIGVISAETGMLGTPRLQQNIVKVRMIFEPRLEPGQKVELQTIESRMNGDYKILSIEHQGTVSGAVCETLETTVTMYQPERALEAA